MDDPAIVLASPLTGGDASSSPSGLTPAATQPMDIPQVEEDGEDQPSGECSASSPSSLVAYTSDRLRTLRQIGLSAVWPPFLDDAFKNDRGVWDPERWHQGKKRGSTPPLADKFIRIKGRCLSENEDGRPLSSQSAESSKFLRDPKDRVRAIEDDGLKLSPQRRGFLLGCAAPKMASTDDDPISSKAKFLDGGPQDISLRPELSGHRRGAGSGRFPLRDRDLEDFDRRYDRRDDDRFRPGGPGYEDSHRGARRTIVLDRDRDRSRERNPRWNNYGREGDDHNNYHQRNNNYRQTVNLRGMKNERHDRRGGSRFPRREETEPEWLNAPVEQGELMELRGFDDPPEEERSAKPEKRPTSKANGVKKERDGPIKKTAEKDRPPTSRPHQEQAKGNPTNAGFNLEEFLQHDFGADPISQMLSESAKNSEQLPAASLVSQQQGSRFSQFFKRPPEQQSQQEMGPSDQDENSEGRRSSIQDEMSMNGRGMMSGFRDQRNPRTQPQASGPNIRIPSPSDSNNACCFAPISPAAKTVNRDDRHPTPREGHGQNPLMDLLKGNAQGTFGPPIPKGTNSVEELESNLKQMVAANTKRQAQAAAEKNKQQQHSRAHDHGARGHMDVSSEEAGGENADGDMSAFQKFAAMISQGTPKPPHAQNGNHRGNDHIQRLQSEIMSNATDKRNQEQGPPMMPHYRNPQFPGARGGPMGHGAHPPGRTGGGRSANIPINVPTEQDILAGMGVPTNQRPPNMLRIPGATGPPPLGPPRLPLTPDLLQLIHSHPTNPKVLDSGEAKSLQYAIAHGHANPMQLLNEFAHREFDSQQGEILVAVLKLMQNKGILPTSMRQFHQQKQQQQNMALQPPRGVSPRSSPLFPDVANLALLQQQQQQSQHQRLSPAMVMQLAAARGHPGAAAALAAAGNIPSGASKPNSLSVSPQPAGQQRIPSPQEISIHTQSIMQNALIKRKLEEQREKYRQRQDVSDTPVPHPQMQRVAAENMRHRSNSDVKPTSSPLTFTPTVVVEKLVSDRRDSDPRPQIPELKISQSGDLTTDRMTTSHSKGHRNTLMSMLQGGAGDVGRASSHGGGGGEDLSGFFSHGVLSRAGPPMPPVPTREAVALGEIERQAAALRI